MVWRSGSSAPSRSRSCGAGSSAMPRRFAARSGPSSRAITSTGCWRRMPTAALLRPGANGSPHAPQSGRPHSSILCPENPGRYSNTAWFEHAFQRRGFRTRQLPNDGKPMLFTEAPNAKPSSPTILFYAHLDGQPVNPSEWAQESPWKPVLKRRGSNGLWEPLPIEDLYGTAIDPEWRLFARSSSDDKAPILMLLAAFDALRAKGMDPSVNVKVLLDSEEEVGSPSLDAVIRG